MPDQPSFTVYNASAGSGKTYTLVKEYLKILLRSSNPMAFKNILALTFTNKAVAEMKERILKALMDFSLDATEKKNQNMFDDLVAQTPIEAKELQVRSKQILEYIAHNYASFEISTIDKFNHKLIRTFAHDLKLPVNFEVELDTPSILNKAVDNLIDKAGTDEELTKILVDFAIEKTDEDKSWDVSYDFYKIAKLLTNENDLPYILALENKSLDDFKQLKQSLLKKHKQLENDIKTIAQETLELIVNHGLQFEDFLSGYLPKYFQKLVDGDFNVNYGLGWQEKLIAGERLYRTKAAAETASTIDNIQNQLIHFFEESKKKVLEIRLFQNILKNMTPLSVLNAINNCLNEIKKDENLLLISEFNAILAKEIKDQPAPFIYERIGEKFRHYFIDEFQDTSIMQWENALPLIDNALSSQNLKGERGTAMIVGDAKQSIYRWRGGKPEQFIGLYNKDNPFTIEMAVENLPSNYRSYKEVVNFNNSFFNYLSENAFSDETHQNIYGASRQDIEKSGLGYVELNFLDVKNEDEERYDLHCQKVHELIIQAQENGFQLKDICVLARKSKEGIAVAEYLSSVGVPVISAESLLLKNSEEVQFINAIINLAIQPDNYEHKLAVLNHVADRLLKIEDKHDFFMDLVHLDATSMFNRLNDFGIQFHFLKFLQIPLYEAVETIVRGFHLNEIPNAYLQYYMDEILEFSQGSYSNFVGFAKYWEVNKDKLSIASPKNVNAVEIMTIHKSKGLEFPVVIFPFANQDIYFDMNPKTWFSVEEEDYHGFPYVFMSLNKEFGELNTQTETIYRTYRAQLELDAINLLYVVMTRAVEQLYIVSELDLRSRTKLKPTLYSELLIEYLKSIEVWEDSRLTYSFGEREQTSKKYEKMNPVLRAKFISTAKEDHQLSILTKSGYLWDTARKEAQEKGNLVHDIMSHIQFESDMETILWDYLSAGKISDTQLTELRPTIKKLISHEKINPYFQEEWTVYNEKDIISGLGEIHRPDRIVINSSNEAVILDYKTGMMKEQDVLQLNNYQNLLERMGFRVSKKILIYINDDIQIKEF